MRIAIIDTLGLVFDGSTLSKRGLGGSESAVILISKELVALGFDVTVFNACEDEDCFPGFYDKVKYAPLRTIETDYEYDIMIASRSVCAFSPDFIKQQFKSFIPLPDFTNIKNYSKHKVLYLHDTFCDGDNLIEEFLLDGYINEVFVLSDFHLDYVTNCEHGKRRNFEVLKKHMFLTRNGIVKYKDWVDIAAKDPNLFVYNASVTKGMIPLVKDIWPRIKEYIPQAKLTVIGGYYKFRSDAPADAQEEEWHKLVLEHPDIHFTGIIKQSDIADILADASFMIYPGAFPETSGISTLESLAYNTPLLTCTFGALEETAFDAACYKIPYAIEPNSLFPFINKSDQIARFVNMVINAWNNKYLHQQKMYACNQIKYICGWDTVALQWKQHFYHKLGEYLPIDEYKKVSRINHKVKKLFGRRFTNPEELQEPSYNFEKEILVITPVYNAEAYIEKCILSVAQQNYRQYNMVIIDDASTDNTREVIKKTIASLPKRLRQNFHVKHNKKNMGAVYNQCTTIEDYCDDGMIDIVMLLDGDDWLINDPNIFIKYNNIYSEGGAEFTYGSCWSVADNIPLIAQEYPPEVKRNKAYRDYKFSWNMPYTHLRTFDPALYDKIETWQLKDEDGNWLRAGGDTALFYGLIENADPVKVVAVPEVIYMYNDKNPLNDFRINSEEQTQTANKVLKQFKDDNIIIRSPFLPGQYDLRRL
jgi:glycosyltransferase involved in cell wall biosynthesis